MKSVPSLIVFLLLLFNGSIGMNAQSQDLIAVKAELTEAAMQEQTAFKNGDCSQVLDLMEDSITFLANGKRIPSKQVVAKFCNAIPRPFKTPLIDNLEIYLLSNTSGYTIRTLEYPNDEATKMQEYVTKLWRKANGQWKISHLHSTVKQVPISN